MQCLRSRPRLCTGKVRSSCADRHADGNHHCVRHAHQETSRCEKSLLLAAAHRSISPVPVTITLRLINHPSCASIYKLPSRQRVGRARSKSSKGNSLRLLFAMHAAQGGIAGQCSSVVAPQALGRHGADRFLRLAGDAGRRGASGPRCFCGRNLPPRRFPSTRSKSQQARHQKCGAQ